MAQGPDYDELARRVAEAAADANTALEVAGALQQAAGEPDEDPIGPLICAFNYDLVSPRNTRWRILSSTGRRGATRPSSPILQPG